MRRGLLAGFVALLLVATAHVEAPAQSARTRGRTKPVDSYRRQVMADAPVQYWRLGESSGTAAANAANAGSAGTYVNTPTLGVASALTGDPDTSVTFASASTEYVSVGDVASIDFERTASFSLECWFRVADTTDYRLFGKLDTDVAEYRGYSMMLTSGNVSLQLISTWSTNVKIIKRSGGAIGDNAWHHAVVVYDGSSTAAGVNFYLDGSLNNGTVVNDALSATILNNINLELGRGGSGSALNPLNGSLDECAIYASVLTAARVSAHYTAGTGGLVLGWMRSLLCPRRSARHAAAS